MAHLLRYSDPWHVGETARPFEVQLADADGAPRPISSASFSLINRDADNARLVADEPCNGSSDRLIEGFASYRPTVEQMVTACRVVAQFRLTLINGHVLIVQLEGEILPTY